MDGEDRLRTEDCRERLGGGAWELITTNNKDKAGGEVLKFESSKVRKCMSRGSGWTGQLRACETFETCEPFERLRRVSV